MDDYAKCKDVKGEIFKAVHRITQHIRYGLTPLPFGTIAFGNTVYAGDVM